MCGILGVVSQSPVNQFLYDGLQLLQHRGQDAAGIVTTQNNTFYMHKANGMVRDVFRTRNMRNLAGNAGIAHVRYPTAGNVQSSAEAQPFYVNSPFGIVLAHNGNLTNTKELFQTLWQANMRHINTLSDSEILLNVLAHELELTAQNARLTVDNIFDAVTSLHKRVKGAYATVSLIAGYGLLAFRDPSGIRPLTIGVKQNEDGSKEYALASESVAFECFGYEILRDVDAGEAIFISFDGTFHSQQCAQNTVLAPCLFEYVYFARPDSTLDGASVYQTRLNMGVTLAEKVKKADFCSEIDVVMPIPDTSRPSALQLANHLNIPYREGFIKNRYIGRTFIMPGQATRKKSVRQKLNPVRCEFEGQNVLLVDDSIVRGTTCMEIVQMARDMGAKKVYVASAAPEVRFPNVYGIDMPTRKELLATGRTTEQIAKEIGADGVIFQDLDALITAVQQANPKLKQFETSCFSGTYITGDITQEYLDEIEDEQGASSISTLMEMQEAQMIDHNLNVENDD